MTCRRTACAAPLLVAALTGAAGCEGGRSEYGVVRIAGGDPRRGIATIEDIGCGACHMIPGVDGAEGMVGPPLISWSRRSYIAGAVPNVPRNLIQWVVDAHSIEPGTAMPDLDVSEAQARDVAAYLYTLR